MQAKKRTEYIALLLTQEEKLAWQHKADSHNMTLSAYIRHCVERRTSSTPIPEINRLTYHQLTKIALSLSHATKRMNAAKSTGENLPSLDEVARTTTDTLQVVRYVQCQLLGLVSEEEIP